MEDIIKYIIEKENTNIYGLKYKPIIKGYTFKDEPKIYDVNNTTLGIQISHIFSREYMSGQGEFSEKDREILKSVILNSQPKTIVEIGVHRSGKRSSTMVIFGNKNDDCIYLGIDKECKKVLNNNNKLIYTIKSLSQNYNEIFVYMEKIGIQTIDLLHIDSFHSVDQVIVDWKYVELLSPTGVIVMHDTNGHPGPKVIFEAADKNIFDKEKFNCWENGDKGYGISVLKKK